MGNEAFDLDALIASINNDKSKAKSGKDYLNKVLMNTRDNQGCNTFIPIIQKKSKNIYTKLPRVYEFFGDTSLIPNGEAWYRILPLEYYGALSAEDIDLYNEVKSYLDVLNDNEDVDRDEFRVRNYSLFTGICLNLKNSENKIIDKYKDCPCLFVYPSNAPIDQLGIAINAKCDAMQGKHDWLSYVITPANKGRQGVMQITFTKSAGVGYDASVNFEMNSSFNQIIDPEFEISDETMSLFDDVIPEFLGWIYDSANNSYFNRRAFIELRTQIKDRAINLMGQGTSSDVQPEDSTKVYENKNGVTPSTPVNSGNKVTPF